MRFRERFFDNVIVTEPVTTSKELEDEIKEIAKKNIILNIQYGFTLFKEPGPRGAPQDFYSALILVRKIDENSG